MNTNHFQTNTAYLDGILLTLDGEKMVTITYGNRQCRFHVAVDGTVSHWGDTDTPVANDKAFELYRMSYLEALLSGGSLIIRQLGSGKMTLPASLGGGEITIDHVCGAELGAKGVRGLRGDELKAMYNDRGGMAFRDLPSKDQVKIALLKQVEADAA